MNIADPALQSWIETHPYLEKIADFHQALDSTAAAWSRSLPVAEIDFNRMHSEFEEGVPLLRSSNCRIAYEDSATDLVARLAETAETENTSDSVVHSARRIRELIAQAPEGAQGKLRQVVEGSDLQDVEGRELLRLLSWRAVREVLGDVTRAFDDWRSNKTWEREYCPTCGNRPVLAQLLPIGNSRERAFICGCCQTQWIYKRIGCPYCLNTNPSTLSVWEIEEEDSLRLDACNECKGYTKTYTGNGDETTFRTDWTTLHLDVLANQQGLKRLGTSLYQI